jgi:hypothetical protein
VEPLSIEATVRRRWATGGVRKEKEKVRSGLIVILVGTGTVGLR